MVAVTGADPHPKVLLRVIAWARSTRHRFGRGCPTRYPPHPVVSRRSPNRHRGRPPAKFKSVIIARKVGASQAVGRWATTTGISHRLGDVFPILPNSPAIWRCPRAEQMARPGSTNLDGAFRPEAAGLTVSVNPLRPRLLGSGHSEVTTPFGMLLSSTRTGSTSNGTRTGQPRSPTWR